MPSKSTCAVALALLAASSPVWAADGPPVAPVRPVTDTYFGTQVVDNYRYLEDLKDPEVQAWMKDQAAYTRKVIEKIPGRDAMASSIQHLMGKDLRRGDFTRRGERLFYLLHEPDTELPKLTYREGLNGEEHVIVDPAKLSSDAAHHFALDWYSPSWDGRYVAYGLSEGGSEKSVLHILDLTTGKALAESIDRTSGSVVSWRTDNQTFFYLRFPKAGPDTPPSQTEFNAATYLHILGQNPQGDGDEAVFGRGVSSDLDVPEGEGTYVLLAPDSHYAVAVANHNMDNNPSTYYVASLDTIHGAQTPWKRFATTEDGITKVSMHGDRLYLLSEKGAAHFQIISASLDHPDLSHPDVIVAEGPNVLDTFVTAGDALYVGERAGASFELHRVSYDGKTNEVIKLPFAGTIYGLESDPRATGTMFNLQGWVNAPREIAYDADTKVAADTGLIPPSKTESKEVEAHDEFATSYDGTLVPVSIISKKGAKRDGSHPTIVLGYGSYGLSLDPFYFPAVQAWLGHNGIIAISHIRGGGEYGDGWHRAGQKLWKINTLLDFLATAQHLVDRRYTQRRLLAANGGSAGGIPMGGALNVDPGLFRVVLDEVGMSDALRFETEPNGPPNVPEFGSVSTEEGFHGLYAMSAYAHVHDGIPYPAVMFITGANDPRVGPWHMLKMAARVQAATSSGRPVLLRIDYDAGHGIGSALSQYVSQAADEWAFTLWQMGDPAFQPKH
ncbi:MAG: prolyl oligopeptidase family serine peptidase [Burkholderiaceae bacterium]